MVELVITLFLIVVPFISGSLIERSHYRSIRKREDELIKLPTVNIDCAFDESDKDFEMKLVEGSVVLAADRFKVMLASLRNFFGGSVSAFETLTDRARREAILRLREKSRGCHAIMNLRLETAQVGKENIEVFAYATAIYYKH
jgi:uncharacterized protein YbjQ (UPF0145 family)